MKKLLIVITSLAGLVRGFSQQTHEEIELRTKGNFKTLLKETSSNKKENCLCTAAEQVIFSFQTTTARTASLCITKTITEKTGYLVYRFGTAAKTEFVFPADTLNSFSHFTFTYYMRGGGKQNAGIELNGLEFINNDFTYKIGDDYTSEDNKKDRYILITNNKTKKTTTIAGKKNITGGLYILRDANIVKYDPDRID